MKPSAIVSFPAGLTPSDLVLSLDRIEGNHYVDGCVPLDYCCSHAAAQGDQLAHFAVTVAFEGRIEPCIHRIRRVQSAKPSTCGASSSASKCAGPMSRSQRSNSCSVMQSRRGGVPACGSVWASVFVQSKPLVDSCRIDPPAFHRLLGIEDRSWRVLRRHHDTRTRTTGNSSQQGGFLDVSTKSGNSSDLRFSLLALAGHRSAFACRRHRPACEQTFPEAPPTDAPAKLESPSGPRNRHSPR